MTPLNVCVYGSSSARTPENYLAESRKLGHLLAEQGHFCINGAGKHGCMGALNDGIKQKGGRVRGVIHAKWVVDKVEHPYIVDLVVVQGDDLQERKKALVHGVDVIIALPGGPGTWDEMWEMACQRGIGFSGVPIVAVNVDGFYDGFVKQLQRADEDGLLYLDPDQLVHFEPDAASALKWCVEHIDALDKRTPHIPIMIERVARVPTLTDDPDSDVIRDEQRDSEVINVVTAAADDEQEEHTFSRRSSIYYQKVTKNWLVGTTVIVFATAVVLKLQASRSRARR